ncbi:DUF3800 domain-containing protein [Chelatococcus asaccharovorans]|uniref:DUF3800 domain-containing protein n=1 Tax=Chelatococcus asaccharovorans TaxID=28210 RepID=UPI001472CAD9|nr:DUF3800 domain-containing protein [Chelatococcus asaccharovorans]MBS7702688.1 DUF3800 domain-containing protein [Chelatococcus asaccharovorans]
MFIDEAGDEGLDKVRPIDPGGASEYFVMAGILVSANRKVALTSGFAEVKRPLGLAPDDELHFRDLKADHQKQAIQAIGAMEVGLVAIVSNKRNMKGYKNRRVEMKNFHVVRGRVRPQNYNWFYNHMFRYLLESASEACLRKCRTSNIPPLPIKIIFAHRANFAYSQTQAYLHKLKLARLSSTPFNNKRQITWPVVDIDGITSDRPKNEPGLQIADCVASAIFQAIDEDNFKVVQPAYLQALSPRFIRKNGTPREFGFKLIPDGFVGPLSPKQQQSLVAVGYRFPDL